MTMSVMGVYVSVCMSGLRLSLLVHLLSCSPPLPHLFELYNKKNNHAGVSTSIQHESQLRMKSRSKSERNSKTRSTSHIESLARRNRLVPTDKTSAMIERSESNNVLRSSSRKYDSKSIEYPESRQNIGGRRGMNNERASRQERKKAKETK
jgi:hypothetical protein